MKLGFSEFILILIVIGVILLVFRGMPAPRTVTPPPARVRGPSAAEIEEARIKSGRRNRMRALGGAFIIIGLVVLGSAFKVFDYVFMMSAGAGLIVILGIVILLVSVRR